MKYFLLASVILFSSCQPVNNIDQSITVKDDHVITNYYEDEAQILSLVFMEADKEDLVEMYKYFAGTSEFAKNAPNDSTVEEVFGALAKTREKYDYKVGKYENITKSTNEFLKDKGFGNENIPTEKVSKYRDKLIKSFNTLAEATKRARLQNGLDIST